HLLCCHRFLWCDAADTDLSSLSLHDALPIYFGGQPRGFLQLRGCPPFLCINTEGRTPEGIRPVSGFEEVTSSVPAQPIGSLRGRSEEHTSELQSRFDVVCRLPRV